MVSPGELIPQLEAMASASNSKARPTMNIPPSMKRSWP